MPPESDLLETSATELAGRLRRRELGCRELMQATLQRIEALNPRFNALVSLRDPDALLGEADERDAQIGRGERMGWMHGFPLAVKDLSPAAGLPFTMGSPLFARNVARDDALFVQRMRRAGAIVIGKSNTPEFGLGSQTYNPVFGTTLNAYDPTLAAGGSSGGAAVALALRMLPVADGSDMGGSLRNPAAYNNIYGLRPSFGRVPSVPADDVFFQQLGTEGPMGRSPQDVACLLAVQSGFDPRAPLSRHDSLPDADSCVLDGRVQGVRIGWLGSLWDDLPIEDGIETLCLQALGGLNEPDFIVGEARLPFPRARNWNAWTVLRQFIVGGKLAADYAAPARRAQLKPEAQWEIEAYLRLTAAQIRSAAVDRSALHQAFTGLFDTWDVLALPTAQVFPFDARVHWPTEIAGVPMDTYHRWMEIVTPMTLAGLPTMSVPVGFDARGRAMGMQWVGRPGADLRLLCAAQAYHERTGWPQKAPPGRVRQASVATR